MFAAGGLGIDNGRLDDRPGLCAGDVADTTVAAFDQIHDWNVGDKINLSAIDADTTLAGDQAFAFIGSAAFSAAGQLRVTVSTNTFVTGDTNGDGAEDFKIMLSGAQTLSAGSFIL